MLFCFFCAGSSEEEEEEEEEEAEEEAEEDDEAEDTEDGEGENIPSSSATIFLSKFMGAYRMRTDAMVVL